jgi:hypothetical protein
MLSMVRRIRQNQTYITWNSIYHYGNGKEGRRNHEKSMQISWRKFFIQLVIGLVPLFSACSGGSVSSDTYTISGYVSGTIESGVTINIAGYDLSGYTTTNSTGGFSFSGIPEGSYIITPSLSGYTFTPAYQGVTISGADAISIDFASTASTGQ